MGYVEYMSSAPTVRLLTVSRMLEAHQGRGSACSQVYILYQLIWSCLTAGSHTYKIFDDSLVLLISKSARPWHNFRNAEAVVPRRPLTQDGNNLRNPDLPWLPHPTRQCRQSSERNRQRTHHIVKTPWMPIKPFLKSGFKLIAAYRERCYTS